MSELMQLLTGANPYPIPASAYRPMPLLESGDVDDDEPCDCSACHRPGLTEKDFYIRPDGRLFSTCKRCFCAAKNAKRRAKCA